MQLKIKDTPDFGGRDKGCHWTCNGLDGTKRWPHGCSRRLRVPACLPGLQWERPAYVFGAHTLSGSNLGSPHLRSRDHTWGEELQLALLVSAVQQSLSTLSIKCTIIIVIHLIWVTGMHHVIYRFGKSLWISLNLSSCAWLDFLMFWPSVIHHKLYSPCLRRCGWVKGLGWPRYRAGTVFGINPPGFTEMFLHGHLTHPADRKTAQIMLRAAAETIKPPDTKHCL